MRRERRRAKTRLNKKKIRDLKRRGRTGGKKKMWRKKRKTDDKHIPKVDKYAKLKKIKRGLDIK